VTLLLNACFKPYSGYIKNASLDLNSPATEASFLTYGMVRCKQRSRFTRLFIIHWGRAHLNGRSFCQLSCLQIASCWFCWLLENEYMELERATRRMPELVILTAPNIHEYFYTKIRFSTPAHVGLRVFCAYCKKCGVNLGSKSSGWPNEPLLNL
jgi:hypothetical protein